MPMVIHVAGSKVNDIDVRIEVATDITDLKKWMKNSDKPRKWKP